MPQRLSYVAREVSGKKVEGKSMEQPKKEE